MQYWMLRAGRAVIKADKVEYRSSAQSQSRISPRFWEKNEEKPRDIRRGGVGGYNGSDGDGGHLVLGVAKFDREIHTVIRRYKLVKWSVFHVYCAAPTQRDPSYFTIFHPEARNRS